MVWLGNFSSIKPSPDGRNVCVRVFTEFEVEGRIVHVNLLQTEVLDEDRAVAHELIADALATEEQAVREAVYTEYIKSFTVDDPRTLFGNAAQAA
jgi:hypothetical protein